MVFLESCIDRPISYETHQAWFLLVGDLSADQFKRAIIDVVKSHKFSGLPPVGLIRQAAGVSSGAADADSAAVIAWGNVLQAMRTHGGYISIDWQDPAIPAAIKICAGSWARLCETEIDQLHTWTKKAFCEAYKASRTARLTATESPGLLAVDAGRLGGEPPQAIRIGHEPPAVYGFGLEAAKSLPGPAATVATAMSLPRDEPRRIAHNVTTGRGETPEEFAERKALMSRKLTERFATK